MRDDNDKMKILWNHLVVAGMEWRYPSWYGLAVLHVYCRSEWRLVWEAPNKC